MSKKLTVSTFTAPSHWACYFLYDDPSGLDDFEILQADRWLRQLRLGAPVSVQECGFMQWHDARMDGCSNVAADCAEYTFLSYQ